MSLLNVSAVQKETGRCWQDREFIVITKNEVSLFLSLLF